MTAIKFYYYLSPTSIRPSISPRRSPTPPGQDSLHASYACSVFHPTNFQSKTSSPGHVVAFSTTVYTNHPRSSRSRKRQTECPFIETRSHAPCRQPRQSTTYLLVSAVEWQWKSLTVQKIVRINLILAVYDKYRSMHYWQCMHCTARATAAFSASFANRPFCIFVYFQSVHDVVENNFITRNANPTENTYLFVCFKR